MTPVTGTVDPKQVMPHRLRNTALRPRTDPALAMLSLPLLTGLPSHLGSPFSLSANIFGGHLLYAGQLLQVPRHY